MKDQNQNKKWLKKQIDAAQWADGQASNGGYNASAYLEDGEIKQEILRDISSMSFQDFREKYTIRLVY